MTAFEPPPLNREQLRAVDRRAVEQYGMTGLVLMENAGRGAVEQLRAQQIAGKVLICCGRGNNGGDGFVMARHLENAGHDVLVLLFAAPDSLQGDAAANWNILQAAGTPCEVMQTPPTETEGPSSLTEPQIRQLQQRLAGAEWIVDALLGTGATGPAREPLAAVIRCINQAGKRVLAVDLPSGLDCDTGLAAGDCIRAERTVTFAARKTGFEAATSTEFTGPVELVGIGVPVCLLREIAEDDELKWKA